MSLEVVTAPQAAEKSPSPDGITRCITCNFQTMGGCLNVLSKTDPQWWTGKPGGCIGYSHNKELWEMRFKKHGRRR